MLLPFDDAPEIADPRDAVVMRKLYADEDVSMTWVRLDGRHRRLRTERSTRVYHVLSGRATFVVGEERIEAGPNDTVVVPRGVPYELRGELTYLVVNGPGFVDGDDVYGADEPQ